MFTGECSWATLDLRPGPSYGGGCRWRGTSCGMTDVQAGQSLREPLQTAVALIPKIRNGKKVSLFKFLIQKFIQKLLITKVCSCPAGDSGGLPLLLSSDFLPFPLELRLPRCFGEGREARTDSGTEQHNRHVFKLEKDNKQGRGHCILTVYPQ